MVTKTDITLSRLAALLLFLSFGFWLPAQTVNDSYDNAGNRTGRTVSPAANAAPSPVAFSVDTAMLRQAASARQLAPGWEVSVLRDVTHASLVRQGGYNEIRDSFFEIGRSLHNPYLEMMATILDPDGSGKDHWINIYKLAYSGKLQLFGGGQSEMIRFFFWDPATGKTSFISSIKQFRIYKFPR